MDRRLVLQKSTPNLGSHSTYTPNRRTSTCFRQLVPYAGVSLIRFTDPAFAISAFKLKLKALRQVKILYIVRWWVYVRYTLAARAELV